MVEEFKDDPVLERIEHQLFHLVEAIYKMTDKIERVSDELDELGCEIYKNRIMRDSE